MNYLMRMAWRNLGRHRGRTALSLLAVVMGVFVVVMAKGFVDGMLDSWIMYNISLNSGHVRIIQPEYELKERMLSLAHPVGDDERPYSDIVEDIRRLPEVSAATGRIRFGMMLVAGEDLQETAFGIGTELDQEERAVRLSRFLADRDAGRLPEPGRQEIVMGEQLMAKLRLRVGDKVTGLFSTSFGSLGLATFQVVGRMSSGLKLLDETSVYIPLDVAMRLLDMDDAVTEIVVFGQNTAQTPALMAGVQRVVGPGLKAVPWNEYNELISYMQQVRAIYTVIYAFLVVLASFVVFNTLLMVVSERTREIGMLSALGLNPASIRHLFLLEGAIVAVAGSIAGAVMGWAFNWWFGQVGLDIASMTEALGGDILMTPRVYPTTDLSVAVFSFILGVAVTMIAVYLPARRAGSLRPTEALRTA
ncbi:MAG: ABC transporter permease [Firmicutes bacterium]|jgi:putative ABC transport system permease protein|nr:ABC transporter permease [Bacillota bacterium]